MDIREKDKDRAFFEHNAAQVEQMLEDIAQRWGATDGNLLEWLFLSFVTKKRYSIKRVPSGNNVKVGDYDGYHWVYGPGYITARYWKGPLQERTQHEEGGRVSVTFVGKTDKFQVQVTKGTHECVSLSDLQQYLDYAWNHNMIMVPNINYKGAPRPLQIIYSIWMGIAQIGGVLLYLGGIGIGLYVAYFILSLIF